jgi:DNA polymerase (family 10)
VRVVEPAAFATAVLWATGCSDHLRCLAERAAGLGLELDRGGLKKNGEQIEAETEIAVYQALGCQEIAPELREGRDEVELALEHRLPDLVTPADIRGALHNHTADSDGRATLEEMAAAAAALGWEYLGVADHSPAAHYANGVDGERLRDQWRRIDALNASQRGPRLLRGLEADILRDGDLDIPEGCRDGLDYVVGSVHSSFALSREEQTERLLRAVRQPCLTVLGHPTGRLLLARPGYEVDLDRVLEECAEHGVVVEINASPYRLDLDSAWARRALELGVFLVVNPDAHEPATLADVGWGVSVARRAGAGRAQLLNCLPVEELVGRLGARRGGRR